MNVCTEDFEPCASVSSLESDTDSHISKKKKSKSKSSVPKSNEMPILGNTFRQIGKILQQYSDGDIYHSRSFCC